MEETRERLEMELGGLSKWPWVDRQKKDKIRAQLEKIESNYLKVATDATKTTTLEEASAALDQGRIKYNEDRKNAIQKLLNLSQNTDYEALKTEIEELGLYVKAATLINETLSDSNSHGFQNVQARACLIELKKCLKDPAEANRKDLRESLSILEKSLNYETQLDEAKTLIEEETVFLQRKITAIQLKLSGLMALSKISGARKGSEIMEELKRKFEKVKEEYVKAEIILNNILQECASNSDPITIMSIIGELTEFNLRDVYL